MVHVTFDPSSTRLAGNIQSGGQFYEGEVFQRGRGAGYPGRHTGEGVGDILRGVWRYLKPMALTVGKEAADAGSRILGNIAQGEDLKETVKNEGKEGVKRILEKASRKLQKGSGAGRRRRRTKRVGRSVGRNKGLNPKSEVILKPDPDLVGKVVPANTALRKRAKSDSLGLY